jgi:ATP-dependent Clp protease ATP-binding subunit ClpC
MGNLNPNLLSGEMGRVMTTAVSLFPTYQKKLLTPQLLLIAILGDKESSAYQVLQQLSQQNKLRLNELQQRAETMAKFTDGRDAHFMFTDDMGQSTPLADEMLVVLDEARSLAQSRNESKISSAHALAIMTTLKVTTAGVLQKLGITQADVIAQLDNVNMAGNAPIIHDFIQEAQQGTAQPLHQREALLQALLGLLALSRKGNVILVGAEGVGKKSLVLSLAHWLAETKPAHLNLRTVVMLNEVALLEDPLKTMRAGLRRATGGVLLVPRINRFFGDRLRMKFPEQVCRELHKAMLEGEVAVVGTAVPADYELLANEDVIRQTTQRLDVPPATREEARAMLTLHRLRLEQAYELQVEDAALDTAVSLADQHIKNSPLPASALHLLERACAEVRLAAHGVMQTQRAPLVDPADITLAASTLTRIPLQKLNADEKSRYANMVEQLRQRIIGQEEAVLAVSRAVKIARVGLRDAKRPIGSFLFLGPSGVGKSELAKALAEFMFGSENQMITLDMSEYQEEASLNRLIGAPPGYVGFESGGQLTNYVRDNPYTVVLFDEVEKAHQKVFDVLLQLLDEGRLTDGQGRLTTFSETVVIMTSNLGARHMLTPTIGEAQRELVMAAVHEFFRPEFLNRLDDVILFHQLNPDQLALIFDLLLNKEIKLATTQKLDIALTPAAKAWMLAQNSQPEFGARPLRRILTRYLREPLVDHLLNAHVESQGATVLVDAPAEAATELRFEVIPK